MTHLSNYGSDRLALLVFDSLIKYLQCWTNLKLSSEHPVSLAERYFAMNPGEIEPVWQVLLFLHLQMDAFWSITEVLVLTPSLPPSFPLSPSSSAPLLPQTPSSLLLSLTSSDPPSLPPSLPQAPSLTPSYPFSLPSLTLSDPPSLPPSFKLPSLLPSLSYSVRPTLPPFLSPFRPYSFRPSFPPCFL